MDRAIEIVDRVRMAKHLYPTMLAMQQVQEINARDMENLIAAIAEGYPFPCNFDVDSPLSGLAPASRQDILRQALKQARAPHKLNEAIDAYTAGTSATEAGFRQNSGRAENLRDFLLSAGYRER